MDSDQDHCLDSCYGLSLPPLRSSKGLRAASFLEKAAAAVPVKSFFLFLELALVADPDDSHD